MEKKQIRRLTYLSVVFVLLMVVFIIRLLDRQVLRREQYTAKAQKQYYAEIEQPAKRGKIYIKDSQSESVIGEDAGIFPVATDLELFDILVTPKNVKDKNDAADKLSSILELDRNELFEKINNDKPYLPPIKKRVSKQIADQVEGLEISGVATEAKYSRFYPENDFMSHILGFVDFEGRGRYGVEEYYDGVLKGEGGTLKGLKDNTGKVIKVEESVLGKDGASLVLTIDRSIQYVAEKKLKEGIERYGAKGGSIIIADPKTGGILAMASSPSYNPNTFNEIASDQQGIFLNPAISLNWEPGSIFKPIIVSAAICEKKVDVDTKPTTQEGGFSNMVEVDGYEIHNALDKPYGYETVTQILENSDNVGMVWVANKVGNELLGGYLNKYGFGGKTGIDLAGEASGQVSPAKKWRDVNRATISFGQGISTTPIQMVASFSAIANSGKMVKPHVLSEIIEGDGTKKQAENSEAKEIISQEDAQKMVSMLVSVVENGHGKKAAVEGFKVAGKTGTAQIPKTQGGYEEDDHIGSFIGFAPADDAKFVMLVKFDRPANVEWAESSAAPIFGEIADWLLNSYLKVSKN
ncbi:MAG: Stage V sporulation protein D [candidate division WS2 bacterium ADurb.Bin280]|uniref:Stage V sporulation protein D n=1 Tax=candidate division WS2 bacterium ADurb.Bin280 TaxID=1852829 RepID=A0A1V5SF04_9BACT|nr:MAG: Stage V sporulation protein D [candidate division WS2 bacterium ADurb.Bin280]